MCLVELQPSPVVVMRDHVCYIHVNKRLSNAALADLSLNLSAIFLKEKGPRVCV